MRYSITSPETELVIATVDHLESQSAAPFWSVTLVGDAAKNKPICLDGAQIKLDAAGGGLSGSLEVYLPTSGARQVFPVYGPAPDGSFSLATALGLVRLVPSRGVMAETAAGGTTGSRSIKSSMPGKVLKLLCKPGDRIEAGQPLLIIEAMKMENEIRSPHAGVVEEIPVSSGQSVQSGDLLAKVGKGQ